MQNITFIGGGNMASAMIGGLIATGFDPCLISVSEPVQSDRLKSLFPKCRITQNNSEAAQGANMIIFSVKPQVMPKVCKEMSKVLVQSKPLLVSIAAGIRVQDLQRWVTDQDPSWVPAIIRVMPNTPALVNQGALGMYASHASEDQKSFAWNVLQSISKAQFWIQKEELMDVVTAVSGSGPAYFFLLVECLTTAGVDAGLDYETAKGLASQTCLGAGAMLMDSKEDPGDLRRKVTSPKGTTEAAVKVLQSSDIQSIFSKAVQAAIHRGVELGQDLGKL